MLLLKQDITRKEQIDQNNATKLDAGEDKDRKYKLEVILNSAVYIRKSKSGYLLGIYHLVS